MLKRGQISVFVIIGIVIAAIIVTSFYLSQKSSEANRKSELAEISQLPLELQQEKEKIEDCLSEVVQEATITIGVNGGYIINEPEKTVNYLGNNVAYLESVSKERIESELENYVRNNFGRCKNNAEVDDANAVIEDDRIIMEAEMPVTLEIESSSAKISFFKSETDIGLGRMLNIIENLRNDINCVTCLMDETEKNEMKATINILDNAKIIVIEDVNYAFGFAAD